MMTERHRLRALQMRETGHDHIGGIGRAGRQRQLQHGDVAVDGVDGVAYPELQISGDLIVARPRRVQPAGDGADELGSTLLRR